MTRFTQKGLFLLLLVCSLVSAKAQDIRISEFLATNTAGILDNDNTLQGWIEIWNPSRVTKYNLSGWKLTHGASTWTFPSVEILPDDRLLIWASGKNRTAPVTAPLHTNFTLDPAGGTLQLIRSGGTVSSEFVNYPAQSPNISYGRDAVDTTLAGFYSNPTPEAPNNYSGSGVAGKVVYSVTSKAFTGSFQLTLAQATLAEGAEIRYTTTGTVPTSSSALYTTPITISSTTQVRARVFQPGKLPGETETECFILIDSTISNNFTSKIPVIVMTDFNSGKPVDGTGNPPDTAGYAWVFEPSATDGLTRVTNTAVPTLYGRIGMDLRGSSTLGNPKYNLNVEFRRGRGEEERDVPLLGMPSHSDWVFHAPYAFDRSLVHNPFMYALSNSIKRYATRTRMAEVFIKFNTGTSASLSYGTVNDANGFPVSGYMGVYNIMEKIRRGRDRVDIQKIDRYDNDAVSKTGGYIVKVDRKDSGDSGFTTTHEAPGVGEMTNGFAFYYPKEIDLLSPQRDPQEQFVRSFFNTFDNSFYAGNYRDKVNGYRKYLDVPAAIDHHLLNVWSMNADGMRLSGYMHVNRGGKVVYGPIWDFDRALCSTDGRDTDPATWRSQTGDLGTNFFNYTWWNRMFSDPDFYQAYIDRWTELRRNEFSPASVNALLDQLNNEITPEAAQRDLTRWAQGKRNWTSPFTAQSFTGQTAEIQRIKDWLQQRANFMDLQWVRPVTITPEQGNVGAGGVTVTMSAPKGVIYYTTDGSDPRPDGGAVPTAANVQVYSGPITVSSTARIRARAYNAAHTTTAVGTNNPPLISKWSGQTTARFAVDLPAAAGNLTVTEINYHPKNPTAAELLVNPLFTDADFEYVEIKNIGAVSLDLAGVQITTGITFSFTGDNALSLAPGERAIIAANPTAFAARYGTKPNVVGPFQGDLSNGGEQLILVNAANQTILDFTYDDAWYSATDGGGQSLVVYDQTAPAAAYSTAANWRASVKADGSPGEDETPFVTTLDATEITATTVKLNAIVSPNGTATTPEFVLGEVRHTADIVPATSGAVTVAKEITGLSPHTVYTFKAEATNTVGTRAGVELNFETANRQPTALDKEPHVVLQTSFDIDVLAGATDPDNDVLTISAVTQGEHGTVAISADGKKLTYTPSAEYTGNDSFTYTIDDGFGGSDTATVNLKNALPIASDKSLHFRVRTPIEIDVLATDSDPDNDGLTISAVTQGEYGTVAISTDGKKLTYTPGAEYAGNDSFTYTISDGFGGTDTATVTLHNALPLAVTDIQICANAAITFDPLANDSDPDEGDVLTITSVNQGNVGTVTLTEAGTLTYTPGPEFFGSDSFTYTVSDESGGRAAAFVFVRTSVPIALNGPALRSQVPGQPDGTVYGSIGLPKASGIFSGTLQTGRLKQRAIFAADGTVLLKIGGAAPGIENATIATLGEPSGRSVLVTIKGPRGSGISTANDQVLYTGLGIGEDTLKVGAREGDIADPTTGAKLKSILSIDGNGSSVFFLAKLAGPGVKLTNDLAVCVTAVDSTGFRLLVRKQDKVDGKPITLLSTLVAAAGTTAEGRWRLDQDTIGVRVSFGTKEQVLYAIPANATSPTQWTLWGKTGDTYPDIGTVQAFAGVPAFGPDGAAFLAQLYRGAPSSPAKVNALNDQALVRASADGSVVLATKAGVVLGADGNALANLKFTAFGSPIAGANKQTAFTATLAGAGVNLTNRTGIWLAGSDGKARLIARTGDLADGGGRWAAFESLVLPDGAQSGPLFTAKLVIRAADGVKATNNRGLWAVDALGTPRLVLRTGQPLPGGDPSLLVRSFVALTPAAGSLGAANGYGDNLQLSAVVTFTNGSTAIVDIATP